MPARTASKSGRWVWLLPAASLALSVPKTRSGDVVSIKPLELLGERVVAAVAGF